MRANRGMSPAGVVALLLLLTSLVSCVNVSRPPAEQVLGEWQTVVGGFPVTVTYDEQTVRVGDATPVPYVLEGDQLRLPEGASQLRIVAFAGRDEMRQTDPLTGTVQTYTRVR